jgi:hypothetical protein
MLSVLLLVLNLQQPVPNDDFRSIRAFDCDFGGGAFANFHDDGGDSEGRVVTSPPYRYDDHRLIFDSIDYRALRARSVSKIGTVTTTVIPGERLVSFLEVPPDGVPILTSIIRTPRPLNGRPSKTYHAIRSYQLLFSDRGAQGGHVSGSCKATQ